MTVPDLAASPTRRSRPRPRRTFVKAGAFEISELTATTTYDQQTVAFTTNVKEKTRELDATGEVILHPDHQEIHLPDLALRTQGVEWTIKAGHRGDDQVPPGTARARERQLVSADQSLSVDGTIALKGEAPSAALDVTRRTSTSSSSRRCCCRTAGSPAS